MKRILVILMVLLCITPVFATNQIGANVGVEVGSVTYEDADVKTTTTSLIVDVAGTSFFTDNIGLSYGIGIDQALSAKTGDTEVNLKESPLSLSFGAFAQGAYRFDFSKEFKLDLAVGVGFNTSSKSSETLNVKTTMSLFTIDIVADVSAVYFITDDIALIGSVGLDCPVYQSTKLTIGNASTKTKAESVFDVLFTAKVGAAYKF